MPIATVPLGKSRSSSFPPLRCWQSRILARVSCGRARPCPCQEVGDPCGHGFGLTKSTTPGRWSTFRCGRGYRSSRRSSEHWGAEIFRRQHPDWREDQRRAVENDCTSQDSQVWVAEVGASAVGFVAVELDHPERSMGEISMLAVDPRHQGGGIGTALTEFALDRLRDAGMTVAMVETGGDPGHAAARRTYEKAGYVLLPVARYFKNL